MLCCYAHVSCPILEKEEKKVSQYKLEELLPLLPIDFSIKPPLGLYVDGTFLLRIGLSGPIFSHIKFIKNPY